jgi:exodeoxyribonuclease V beta subunit
VIRAARPEILERIGASRDAVIEASAGTGKTFTLVHLVVELVLVHRVPLEQILVVTFTDKATREMRERVRAKLRELLDAKEDAPDASAWTIDDDARRRLTEAIAVFDRAPISTIHAFCQRILTESAFECGRLLRQEQVESRAAFGRAFREELRIELRDGAPLRPVLERALAASGERRVEDALYRWYLERSDPEPAFDLSRAILAMRRLPTRAELAPSGVVHRVLASALKSASPKREVPARLGTLAPAVERLRASGESYPALLAFWDWAELDAPGATKNLAYVTKYLAQAAERQPNVRPLADAMAELGRSASTPLAPLVSELVPRIRERLSKDKSARGHFDFDDMLGMLRAALYAEGSDALVADLRRRYRAALVDEFQDTDRVQWDIVRRIFADDPERRLVLIGDPKQAIYGFRHADVHTYHAAKSEIVERGGTLVPLTVSFRSRAPLVSAINTILERDFFTGVNAYEHPVTCGRPERALVDARGDALPAVTLLHCVGRPELRADLVRTTLAARIAEEISRLLSSGTQILGDGEARELAASDIHVLCRSRSDELVIGDALAAAGVPHAFYKQDGLFQTSAAREVWVMLRAIEDPDDRSRRLDAWLTPFFAVPLERLEECRDAPPEHPLVATLHEHRALADAQEWAALFRSILERSGFVRRELFAGLGERRLTDYQHILELLLEETHRGRRTLPELLARASAFIEGRELPEGESGNVHRLESERRAVQVLTMHKAKGLEAEVVFLAGGLGEREDDALAPRVFHEDGGRRVAWMGPLSSRAKERLEHERREEAERLLYVALTRAKGALYLPYFGPPPPDAPREEGASYELSEVTEPDELPTRSQLSLFFEEPLASLPPAPLEYELGRLNGPYRVLNERLVSLLSVGLPSGFARAEVSVEPRRAERAQAPVVLSSWRAPDLSGASSATERFARLRRERAGFQVTSYTRMKSAASAYGPPDDEPSFTSESVDTALPASASDDLPGGASIGVFLHEVLEHIGFDRILAAPSAAALLEGSRELFEKHARKNAIERTSIALAAECLHGALRARVELAGGTILEQGLASAKVAATELPFLHPIPERSHPALGKLGPGDRPLSIERGYVRGVIDLVIEHEGRYHVVDYKSDRLPSYAGGAVAAHVERNYLVQAKLYTLGTLRALGIHDEPDYERRFGGVLYAFLRGMRDGGGAWTYRPRWDEVLGWERALTSDAPWGYPLPPRRMSVARAEPDR